VWGLVGKLAIHPSLEEQLVLVRECERVGELPEPSAPSTTYPIYRVKSVALLPISPSPPLLETPLKSCPKHHVGVVDPGGGFGPAGEGGASRFPFKGLGGKIGQVKASLRSTAGSAATGIAAQVGAPLPTSRLQGQKALKDSNKTPKRLKKESKRGQMHLFKRTLKFAQRHVM